MRPRLPLLLLLAVAVAAPERAAGATDASASRTLSASRARQAAYGVAQRVGAQEGAVYAVAGYCKRRSAKRVSCWAGIVFDDYTGSAQQVMVTLVGTKVRARRVGRVYTGSVGERQSEQSGGEWAICGIRSSVCIGS